LIPIVLGLLLNLTIDKDTNQGYFIPLNLFFLLFFLVAYLPLRGLRKVEYDKDNLITSNFIHSEIFQLKDVIQSACSEIKPFKVKMASKPRKFVNDKNEKVYHMPIFSRKLKFCQLSLSFLSLRI
jgi:hypothetical protein